MKKIFYALAFIAATNVAYAQMGLLNKVKNKLRSGVQQTAGNAATNNAASGMGLSTSNSAYTDPSKFGTLIYTFSKAEMNAHSGADGYGYNNWFPTIKVINNQIVCQVADGESALYNYAGGQLQLIGGKPNGSVQNKLFKGSEMDGWSVDFSQLDQTNAMLKKGPHIASGMIPGKADQSYTFNGKSLGNFYMAMLAHNADSSVVTVVGASLNGGMSYKMVSSSGLQATLPKKFGGRALISPDGKVSVAIYVGASGFDAYRANGTQVSIGNFNNGQGWLRNSGSIFTIADNNGISLYKDGVLYHTFAMPVDPKMLFISADDKRICWTERGIYFSDGTSFENGQSPHKLVIDNKEVIVFLAVELASGKLYLCRHDL